jgi:hypothetical protein
MSRTTQPPIRDNIKESKKYGSWAVVLKVFILRQVREGVYENIP